MPQPHTVVIPFGVPSEGRGLGIGLAALVHAFAHVDGEGIAIAQLHARARARPSSDDANDAGEGGDAKPAPVEAFVPPSAWNDLARRGDAPALVQVVLTGAIEPPIDGHGTIQLLAFDPRDGRTRAQVDAPLDGAHAGASLVGALEQLWSRLGGELGALGGLKDLEWEPLESVLRAERCALHDPLRGGPHDRLAAMLHLGRAIGDAPDARYPVERLAALALETASGLALDPKLAAAAVRALERAGEDSPGHVEIVEALSALLLRLGRPRDAERHLNAAVASAQGRGRARLYVLLAQSLRAQGHLDAALVAVQSGIAEAGVDPGLSTERGAVLAARGDLAGAKLAWREALARDPVHPAPFTSLGALALRQKDAETAQALADAALASPAATPEVLRRAIHLALATETEGIARASRVARLCQRVLERAPDDAWTSLALARSQMVLGEAAAARERLIGIERGAPRSSAAAEARAVRAVLEDPQLEAELQSVMRAAHAGPAAALGDVAARARRLAALQGAWPAWIAAAAAERRRGRLVAARIALEAAIEAAPGAAVAHGDLAEVLLEQGESAQALEHAQRAAALEGDTPRTLALSARILEALGRPDEARRSADRARAMEPEDAELRVLADRLRRPSEPPGWADRVTTAWRAWTKR
jgi:tetratricopeptide (TPR) repeat protein